MNDTLKSIAKRFSCRSFTDQMPSDEDLRAIADAAIAAPSGMNRQAWRVIVVKNRELIDEMEAAGMAMLDGEASARIQARGGTLYYHAPCMIMVPIATEGKSMGLIDCGILCENIAIAAASLGLGSLICGMAGMPFGGEKGDYFKEKLGFPEGYEFGIAVLLGYAETETAPHEPDASKINFIE